MTAVGTPWTVADGSLDRGALHALARIAVVTLMASLPFEPRVPLASVMGVSFTLLEVVTAFALLVLLAAADRGARARWPAWLLLAFGAANLVSAHDAAGLKFALRMVVMGVVALVVAHAPQELVPRGLAALVAAAAVVAVLVLLEAAGVRGLDPLLDVYREHAFNVAGARRPTGGSEYPNLAAGMLMAGLVAHSALRTARPRAVLLAVLLCAGLVATYSRGAAVATLVALVALAVATRGRMAWIAAAALVVCAALFAGRTEIVQLRFAQEGTREWYGARYEPADTALRLQPGESRLVRVAVTNSGRKTWVADEAFHLSYHWYDAAGRYVGDGARAAFTAAVPVGASTSFDIPVLAPRAPGSYTLAWDMVHESTTWFAEQGVPPRLVPVVVGAAAWQRPVVKPPTLAWTPGRRELWGHALQLFRSHPLLGAGPDAFRRSYGRLAGRTDWDVRVYANNTWLEVAANTGALGVLTLTGAVVAAVLAAWHRRDTSSLAIAAVLVGMLVHWSVDYLLAFTGHYVLLGFLVGGAARPDRSPA